MVSTFMDLLKDHKFASLQKGICNDNEVYTIWKCIKKKKKKKKKLGYNGTVT